MFRVEIKPKALKEREDIPSLDRWRVGIGDYRVLYRIADDAKTVYVYRLFIVRMRIGDLIRDSK